MTADKQKQAAAIAALRFVANDTVIGVGTGSTVNYFIQALGESDIRIKGAVASSARTETLLKQYGITVYDMNSVSDLSVYIDGADEVDPEFIMIKGGGGALTREKIVASASKKYVCIIDASKQVERLGCFPLPIEVIPMARELVTRTLSAMGGQVTWREGTITDNGNLILDVTNLDLSDPEQMEMKLNSIPGVVECGIFAIHRASCLVVGTANGVNVIDQPIRP